MCWMRRTEGWELLSLYAPGRPNIYSKPFIESSCFSKQGWVERTPVIGGPCGVSEANWLFGDQYCREKC